MLGKLGGALRVSMACESPILASWHSMPTKAKIIAHSLEVSKKKVTSVSDKAIGIEIKEIELSGVQICPLTTARLMCLVCAIKFIPP